MNKRVPNKQKGFTLLEMMLVVTIFLILSIGIWISLSPARYAAEHKSILNDMKAIQSRAFILYGHEGFGPSFEQTDICILSLFADENITKLMNNVVLKSSGLTRCTVGRHGLSFAFSIQSEDHSICVDQSSVKIGLATGGGESEDATCQ